MEYYHQKKAYYKTYFDKAASGRIRYRKRNGYYWESITKYVDYYLREDDRILEIGCGTGEMLARVRGEYKKGIDFSEKMIDEAKRQFPEIQFEVMDADDLQLDEKYDVLILSNLVGVLPDIEKVFRQLHKVCHENTRVIITYYNYTWQPIIRLAERFKFKKVAPQQSWLSKHDITNLLHLAGFEVYRQNSDLLFPYRWPLISTIFNKYLDKLPLFNQLGINQMFFARPIPEKSVETWEKRYSTSVVIPARNESGNIENAILRLPKFGKHVEIIFVEGNSTDDTWETIQRIQKKYQDTHDIRILQQPGKGKGDAVRAAYEVAKGDILMILDADLTVPPEEIPKFYRALASGKGEFINGCRLVYPLEKNSMRPFNILGNKFFSLLFSWLMEQPVKDTLCGTKVMFKEDYLKLIANRKYFGEFDPFGDFDLLFGAYKLNLKIIDLPIRYQERTYGDTNISRWKHGLLLLRMSAFAMNKVKFK
jgi:ubiquinone/menaquinone biosynthesis C-methylase UbiE